MRYLGAIIFGFLTIMAIVAVLWLSHGAGTQSPGATVLGLAMSPILYLVFAGPFFCLFVVFLARSMKN